MHVDLGLRCDDQFAMRRLDAHAHDPIAENIGALVPFVGTAA